MNNIILIPIYKPVPDHCELLSFNQCLKILNKHLICIVTHKDLDISYYTGLLRNAQINYIVEYFDNSYFTSDSSYNQLVLSEKFYIRFRNFEYMLIHQLDAWVFRDELDYWCGQGYDFIGAPLIEDKDGTENMYFLHGMNGGLSLRRIPYCIKFLSYKGPIIKPKTIYKILKPELKKNLIYSSVSIAFKMLGYHNNLNYFRKKTFINEDLLFTLGLYVTWVDSALYLYETWIYPRIPEKEIAMKFSFERYPSFLYQLNNNKLPFGCHGWEKYEYEKFWAEHLV